MFFILGDVTDSFSANADEEFDIVDEMTPLALKFIYFGILIFIFSLIGTYLWH